jgi:hypothetical protein
VDAGNKVHGCRLWHAGIAAVIWPGVVLSVTPGTSTHPLLRLVVVRWRCFCTTCKQACGSPACSCETAALRVGCAQDSMLAWTAGPLVWLAIRWLLQIQLLDTVAAPPVCS